MKKDMAKRKADRIVIVAFVAVLALAGIFWLIDPSGNLFRTVMVYSLFVLVGGLALVCLYGLFILMRSLGASISYKLSESAREEHPHFFEEMRSTVSATLPPFEFTFHEQQDGFIRDAKFVRGEYSVIISYDMRDEIYYVTASSTPEKDEQFDFLVTCRDLRKAEKYKSEIVEKLNQWLMKKNLK